MSGLARSVANANRIRPPRRIRQVRQPRQPRQDRFGAGLIGIVAFLFLILGIWIGSNQGGHTPSEVQPAKTVTVTVTKNVTSPQPVPFVPSSCVDASKLLDKMLPLLNRVLAEPNMQSDIITQVKAGIASQDPRVLSSAATQENTEHNNMADVQQELLDYWSTYQSDQAQCISEVGK